MRQARRATRMAWRMAGDDEKMEKPGVVAPDEVGAELDQLGQRPAGRLLLLGRKEVGEVFFEGDVILKSLMVVHAEEVVLQAAEIQR